MQVEPEQIADLDPFEAQLALAHSTGYLRGAVAGLIWGTFQVLIAWAVFS